MTDKANEILDAFKTIVASPVGGWCAAIMVVIAAAWVMRIDTQRFIDENSEVIAAAKSIGQKNNELLTVAGNIGRENQDIIKEAAEVTRDNNDLLHEIRSMMNVPLEARSDIKEALKLLKESKEHNVTP